MKTKIYYELRIGANSFTRRSIRLSGKDGIMEIYRIMRNDYLKIGDTASAKALRIWKVTTTGARIDMRTV
jgi:hypothetical protein